jgi:hypothetical protein
MGEVHRALKPGGRVLLIDLVPHDLVEYRERMGHVWLGFSEPQVTGWLRAVGFSAVKVIPLATDPGAKAPGLFVAKATKEGQGTMRQAQSAG